MPVARNDSLGATDTPVGSRSVGKACTELNARYDSYPLEDRSASCDAKSMNLVGIVSRACEFS
jgi:hypothetical protein